MPRAWSPGPCSAMLSFLKIVHADEARDCGINKHLLDIFLNDRNISGERSDHDWADCKLTSEYSRSKACSEATCCCDSKRRPPLPGFFIIKDPAIRLCDHSLNRWY